MIDAGANPNMDVLSNPYRTALHLAVNYRYYDMTEILINRGADPNKRDGNGETPVIVAVKTDNIDILKLLLDNGGSANKRDNRGHNAYYYGARHPKIYAMLTWKGTHEQDIVDAFEKAQNKVKQFFSWN